MVPHAVFVFDGPFQRNGDDFHVVGVHTESVPPPPVIIQYPQHAKVDAFDGSNRQN